MGKTWRLIDSGPCSASYNMALDEAIADRLRKDNAPPTLRLYGWDMPSVSLGCFQRASSINIHYCRANNIPVVRRPTGGRALLHGDELTYSVSARTDAELFTKGLLDSYRQISAAFITALYTMGIHAEAKKKREKGRVLARSPLCFRSTSYGEILINKKKAIGSAQKRWKEALLQQGSIPYACNEKAMPAIFGEEETTSLHAIMTGIKEELPEFDEDRFKKIIVCSFEETFGIRLVRSLPSEEEHLLALDLEKQKYLRQEWNFRL